MLDVLLVDQYGNRRSDVPTFTTSTNAFSVVAGSTLRAGAGTATGTVAARIGDLVDTIEVSVVPTGTLAVLRDDAVHGLVLQDLDGSNPVPMYQGNILGDPAWNPSGLEVVVTIRGLQDSPGLFVVDPTGQLAPLVPGRLASADARDPQFSADGQWVYFVARTAISPGSVWRARRSNGATELIVEETDALSVWFRQAEPILPKLAVAAIPAPGYGVSTTFSQPSSFFRKMSYPFAASVSDIRCVITIVGSISPFSMRWRSGRM